MYYCLLVVVILVTDYYTWPMQQEFYCCHGTADRRLVHKPLNKTYSHIQKKKYNICIIGLHLARFIM
jgi:hypothetical protein